MNSLTANIYVDMYKRLRECSEILFAVHVNSDGDCIGSALALGIHLKRMGANVTIYSRDLVPENCAFLPHLDLVTNVLPQNIAETAVVFIDAEGEKRCGFLRGELDEAKEKFRIDHHLAETKEGIFTLQDTKAAATGEIIYELLKENNVEIDSDMATLLFTAIQVDTTRYLNNNTTANTYEISGKLVELGADRKTVVEKLYNSASFSVLKLLGLALSRTEIACCGKVVYTCLTREDFKTANATPSDTEGIIDRLKSVDTAEVALLFTEKSSEVKVSIRTREGSIDANEFAKIWSGGGHKRAAGMSVVGIPLKSAVSEVLAELTKRL